jgi:DNA-binding transcriptional ArsR family regulator
MDFSQRKRYLRGLACESRLEIVDLLAQHLELRVSDMTGMLGLPQPAVSKHLKILKSFHIVSVRKVGAQRFYKLHEGCFGDLQRYVDAIQLQIAPKGASQAPPSAAAVEIR